MNISDITLENLNKLYSFTLTDDNINMVSKENATLLNIGFERNDKDFVNYIGKTIKATKKEITLDYIIEKINKDNVYINFCNDFKKLLPDEYKNSINIYPTSYGIGIFVLFNYKNSTESIKSNIESILNKYDIEYKNEYSDAMYVFRYKISKSKENIEKIKNII